MNNSDAQALGPDAQRRKRWWIEVGVVMSVAVIPDFVNAITPYSEDAYYDQSWSLLSLVARSMMVLSVIAFVIWNTGEPIANFGMKAFRPMDIAVAIGLFAIFVGIFYLAWYAPYLMGFLRDETDMEPSPLPLSHSRPGLSLLIVLASAMNGAAEQVAISGFLLHRLKRLLGSWGLAIVLVSICFGSYHLYQAVHSAVALAIGGAVMGIYVAARGRLWPCVIAHGMLDLAAMGGFYDFVFEWLQ
jgi:membrane protease YdiL (CAAX protease family)